jgi:hypothetical protein
MNIKYSDSPIDQITEVYPHQILINVIDNPINHHVITIRKDPRKWRLWNADVVEPDPTRGRANDHDALEERLDVVDEGIKI